MSEYDGLTPKEADDLMVGTIGSIVCEELVAARTMTPEEWDQRDIFRWSYEVASAIYYSIENRRRGAPA
jgi:hypothetical protein